MSKDPSPKRPATRLVEAGRPHDGEARTANPAPERGSTLIFENARVLAQAEPATWDRPTYGRMGLAAHRACEEAFCELEGAAGAVLAPTGLAACTLAALAFAEAGRTIWLSDSIYGPTRAFCETELKRFGVNARFFDPRAGEALGEHLGADACAIFCESPGSLTFELNDLPAIARARDAKAPGAAILIDNTWGAGWFHKPLALGADVSVQSATKYAIGGSDYFLGVACARTEAHHRQLWDTARRFGLACGPEEAYAAQRGLRSLPARLAWHEASALRLARCLEARPEIAAVHHPALESSPDHALWRRDFTGSNGLFAVSFAQPDKARYERFLSSLSLFKAGYSWGGFESLIVEVDAHIKRTAARWRQPGPTVRLHAGLEDPADLEADLAQALDAWSKS